MQSQEKIAIAIKKEIQKVRKERKITQKEIAEKIGVSQGTYSDWENNKGEDLRANQFLILCRYLNICPCTILNKIEQNSC